jgi:DNA-binding SARP family transcriptional activator/tetratricopeptide (TPR) repeat protein
MPGGLQVRLLGRFEMTAPAGQPVEQWPRPTARRLVQLLLLEPGHSVNRDRAAELLFPEVPADKAFRQLSKALSQARSALAAAAPELDGMLDADTRSIRWTSHIPSEIDLDAHVAALRGGLAEVDPDTRARLLAASLRDTEPLLPDDCYDLWVTEAADRLAVLRQQARIALAETLTATAPGGPDGRVIAAWREAFRHDRTDENTCAALMAAYAAAGNRTQVMRAHRACVVALRTELGVTPSARLATAYTHALEQTADAPEQEATTPVLFGRDGEIAVGTNAVRSGPGLVIAGPAGIGKTAVLGAVCRDLSAHGWLVLRGTAIPEDRLSPYAALRTALRPHLTGVEVPPELAALVHGEQMNPDSSEGRDELLAAAVTSTMAELAVQQPILLAIDDAHWADPAMHVLLRRLALRSGGRWSLAVAGRSDERGQPLPDLPTDMVRLDLPPLPDEAATALIRTVATSDVDATELLTRAAGNPFFLTELARAGPGVAFDDVPRRVRDLVEHRLSGCGGVSARIATLVAVAAEDASYDVVLGAARDSAPGGTDDEALLAIDELLDQHLLVELADGVRVAHPLLREALLQRTNAVRRSTLHTLIAAQLDGRDDRAFARARHQVAAFRCSGLHHTAVDACRGGLAAGAHARSLCANDVALELLHAALEAFETLSPGDRRPLRSEVFDGWLTVGHINLDRGQLSIAEHAYRQGLGLAGNDDERARGWSALAGVPYTGGDLRAAAATYEKGLTHIVAESPIPRARLRSDLGWVSLRLGDPALAAELLTEALAVLESSDDLIVVTRCLDRLSLAMHASHRPDEALRLSDRAFDTDAQSGDESNRGVLLMHRSILLTAAGRMDEALADAKSAVELHRRLGRRYLQAVALSDTANVHEARGEWAEALDAREIERAILADLANDWHLANCDERRAALLTKLGRDSEAAAAAKLAADAFARRNRIVDPMRTPVPKQPRRRTARGNTAGTRRS